MIAAKRNEGQQLRELRRKSIKYSYLRLIIFSAALLFYGGNASTDEHFNIPVLTDWSEIRSAQEKKKRLARSLSRAIRLSLLRYNKERLYWAGFNIRNLWKKGDISSVVDRSRSINTFQWKTCQH